LIDRPGAPQSELRVGHLGPLRRSPAYHALVTLNAALGGQFTSRINQHLREAKGYTYGARTGLDFRRAGSTLACETSVQSDATANAIEDILAEFDAVRGPRPLAAAELVRFSLAADTFDRFVPEIAAVNEAAVLMAAKELVRPEEATAVVVGDAERCRGDLARFGRPIVEVAPEF
jgi:zinc protease